MIRGQVSCDSGRDRSQRKQERVPASVRTLASTLTANDFLSDWLNSSVPCACGLLFAQDLCQAYEYRFRVLQTAVPDAMAYVHTEEKSRPALLLTQLPDGCGEQGEVALIMRLMQPRRPDACHIFRAHCQPVRTCLVSAPRLQFSYQPWGL